MPRLRSLLVLELLLALALTAISARGDVVNRIALRINDEIVTLADFERTLADRRQAILAADITDQRRLELMEQAGLRVFEDMYEELLLRSRARQLGVQVSEQEVSAAVAETRQRMGIETEEQMRQALAASGMTPDQLRERMRHNLLVQQVVGQEIYGKIEIAEEELRRVYRETIEDYRVAEGLHLEEIIVLASAIPSEDSLTMVAEEIAAELAAGKTLAEVAEPRAAAGTTTGVIDLGWVRRGDLDPELAEAAWNLETDGYSAPRMGRGGLHILHLKERRDSTVRPFEEVRGQVTAQERERRMTKAYAEYVEKLEREAHIVMNLPPAAAGFEGLTAATISGERRPPSEPGLEEVPPEEEPSDPAASSPSPEGSAPDPAE